MRLRVLVTIAIVLVWLLALAYGAPADAQQPIFPRHPAAPRTCNGSARGFAYHNTTDGKPYECTASGWVDLTATGSVTTADVEAALPVSDATELVKGSVTSTKRVRIEVDALSAATLRVINMPDSDTTLPIASQVLTFTGPSAPRTITLPDAAFTVAGLGTANAFTSTNSFVDGSLTVIGSGDPTKAVRFEADGVSAGATRVITPPNADTSLPIITQTITVTGPTAARTWTAGDYALTIAGRNVNETWTGIPTFGGGANFPAPQSINFPSFGVGANFIVHRTESDQTFFGTGTTKGSWHFAQPADLAFVYTNGACGTAKCNGPSLVFHSDAQDNTNYQNVSFIGTAGNWVTTLTAATPTAVVRIPVPAGAATGGVLEYGVFAADATDQQLRQGSIRYSVTNKAGTETCTLTSMAGGAVTNETDDGNAASISASTLTYGITCTAGTSAVDILFNAVSGLTETTLQLRGRVSHVGPGEPLPF